MKKLQDAFQTSYSQSIKGQVAECVVTVHKFNHLYHMPPKIHGARPGLAYGHTIITEVKGANPIINYAPPNKLAEVLNDTLANAVGYVNILEPVTPEQNQSVNEMLINFGFTEVPQIIKS